MGSEAGVHEPPAASSVMQKAFDLLEAFRYGRVLTLSEVARRADLPKSTAYRILGMLVRVGAVEHEGTGYRVALRMMALGAASPEGAVRHTALPYLLDLHRAVGHTIHLCVLRGPDVVYVEKLHTPRSRLFPTEVGMALPAHCTSVGKVLLAYSDPDMTAAAGAGRLRALTERSVLDPELLRRELRRVRQRGVATDVEEAVPGRSCVAMPIVVGGTAVAAVSIGFPAAQGSSELFVPPLRRTVSSIVRALPGVAA
ncbi:IclR family transcriptional regulator [Streptomyces sp. ID05-04B]|uniref:IclR family transcriptional regulator n=1 Tax=unclassified Streptomyces TaxID=2593676 RepID=UPI000D1B53B8|nr:MULTISPECIES: IclR family transcriptional regulator [unclassified Streptomyces]AVV44206.1 IclR family transcriptional regulator [Streptomyces sp. P3]MDX5568136.1 IclR family transcriptional regulator [Streptomyces sp. ID05-04B]